MPNFHPERNYGGKNAKTNQLNAHPHPWGFQQGYNCCEEWISMYFRGGQEDIIDRQIDRYQIDRQILYRQILDRYIDIRQIDRQICMDTDMEINVYMIKRINFT